MKRFPPPLAALMACLLAVMSAPAQEPPVEGEESGRVKYVLILPDEKNAELVKAEENNPFEAAKDGREEDADTEENQVRDILLAMSASGMSTGPKGIRVMLGGMRLEPGVEVPSVLPDQQVKLRVKDITPNAIELVWVEKKPSGLLPKVLVIPMDAAPKVRYRMSNGGAMGTLRHGNPAGGGAGSGASGKPTAGAPGSGAGRSTADAAASGAGETKPAATEPPPPSKAPEASILRMLFGNHGPAPK